MSQKETTTLSFATMNFDEEPSMAARMFSCTFSLAVWLISSPGQGVCFYALVQVHILVYGRYLLHIYWKRK
jgi:hypothetical protein